jgi:hypothetical protein
MAPNSKSLSKHSWTLRWEKRLIDREKTLALPELNLDLF